MNRITISSIGFFAVCFLLFILTVSGFFVVSGSDIVSINLNRAFQKPGFLLPGGTDELGRNVLARTLYAASVSLTLSVASFVLALIIGLFAGSFAGMKKNSAGAKLIDLFIGYSFSTPFFILLICLLAVLGRGLVNAYFILVLFAWTVPARMSISIVSALKDEKFVLSSQSFGFTPLVFIKNIILPQVITPVLISSLAILPEIIALDAGLSVFGLGMQPPKPSLGKLIADGIGYLSVASWMAFVPAVLLMIICICLKYFCHYLSRKYHVSYVR